ncbi:hypothetical protein FG152_17985 [Ochrobactrum sp. XJ1]|nr:hypothetical protein [Ochrobactrum sp. XJ1]
MSNFIAYLFTLLVISPLQAELSDRIDPAKSTELGASISECVSTAVPSIISQAKNDWSWAMWTVINVSIGATAPESLLSGRGAACDKITTILNSHASSEAKDV